MSYLFDPSAIFKAISKNRVEMLAGNFTLDLAKYELGNVIWKLNILLKTISAKEASRLMETVKKALELMSILNAKGFEKEILALAMELRISFYDASYVYLAQNKGLALVTEDEALHRKLRDQVEVLKFNGLKA